MWKANKDPQKHKYRVNGYRVLLTRARQGIVVYVPRPDRSHSSRLHDQLDATAQFLILCGMEELTSPSVHIDHGDSDQLLQSGHFVLRSEEHTSELQSRFDLVCRIMLEKKKYK